MPFRRELKEASPPPDLRCAKSAHPLGPAQVRIKGFIGPSLSLPFAGASQRALPASQARQQHRRRGRLTWSAIWARDRLEKGDTDARPIHDRHPPDLWWSPRPRGPHPGPVPRPAPGYGPDGNEIARRHGATTSGHEGVARGSERSPGPHGSDRGNARHTSTVLLGPWTRHGSVVFQSTAGATLALRWIPESLWDPEVPHESMG